MYVDNAWRTFLHMTLRKFVKRQRTLLIIAHYRILRDSDWIAGENRRVTQKISYAKHGEPLIAGGDTRN